MIKKITKTAMAITPIFHGGNEKTGSTPTLRTITVYTSEGEKIIPYIHGNALRGRLRRVAMKDLLTLLDYEVKSKSLYHSLFSGGTLEKNSDTGTIDFAFRKRLQEFIPPIALFGGCFENQIIQGIVSVGHMFPVCRECLEFLDDSLRSNPKAEKPVRLFTDESFITRRDEIRDREDDDKQAVQMKVDYECFIPGTEFVLNFVFTYPTSLDLSCFARIFNLWAENPTIGGRSSSGDGLLRINNQLDMDDTEYLEHMKENKDEIIKILSVLDKRG